MKFIISILNVRKMNIVRINLFCKFCYKEFKDILWDFYLFILYLMNYNDMDNGYVLRYVVWIIK